ncbi:hypothetical protein T4A_12540 [Trichinella pseudospiralis]|uniref:Uncharacterized protein n=1 Tax=Trichinella pseudospiralis TaxID=6337 RepID=A0A0V1DXS4_TRIPS|nr:hypothetical protein T4A_12540 [Trichinella pseudospiralis]
MCMKENQVRSSPVFGILFLRCDNFQNLNNIINSLFGVLPEKVDNILQKARCQFDSSVGFQVLQHFLNKWPPNLSCRLYEHRGMLLRRKLFLTESRRMIFIQKLAFHDDRLQPIPSNSAIAYASILEVSAKLLVSCEKILNSIKISSLSFSLISNE